MGRGSKVHSCGIQQKIRLKQLKHAQEHSTSLEEPDSSCAAKIMHEAAGIKAAKSAQEAPPGSCTGPDHKT